MPDDSAEARVRQEVFAMIEARLADPRQAYAMARYLASASFSSWAGGVKTGLIARSRQDHPEETYEQTAARLGTSVPAINRAVSAWNKARTPEGLAIVMAVGEESRP